MRPPIIIIGMHRSGTSMLCKVLEALGLFVGVVKQWNHESPFFQILNEWMLRRCGATYKTPQPLLRMLEDPAQRDTVRRILDRSVESPWAVSYLGFNRYRRHRSLKNLDFPWGWKDPRSTVTLPVWLDVFPQAKIIHIYRHGVDVANSLRNRRRRPLNRLIALAEEIQLRRWRQPDGGASLHTRRLTTLEGGFSLWEEYLVEAKAHVQQRGTNALEIKYEDFLAAPAAPVAELARFCELNPADDDIVRALGKIRTHRSYAYRNVPELSEFAARVPDRLQTYNY